MSLAISCDGVMSPWGGSVCRLSCELLDGIFHFCVRVAVVSGRGDGALCYDVCEIDHEVLW